MNEIAKRFVAIIPARSGSKGVPDKNIKLLDGIPLLAYSIAAAKLSNKIERVIVSTDSQHYANIAKSYGAEVPFLRPEAISLDTSTDSEMIQHALEWLGKNEGQVPEYIIHLRPTTPLRDPKIIDTAIEVIQNDPKSTALRSVQEMSESAYKTFEEDNGYLKTICNGSFELDAANGPRQAFRKTYTANGYVDVIKSTFVLENKMILGNKVIAFLTPAILEIDNEEDFNYLTYQANQNRDLIDGLIGCLK